MDAITEKPLFGAGKGQVEIDDLGQIGGGLCLVGVNVDERMHNEGKISKKQRKTNFGTVKLAAMGTL